MRYPKNILIPLIAFENNRLGVNDLEHFLKYYFYGAIVLTKMTTVIDGCHFQELMIFPN